MIQPKSALLLIDVQKGFLDPYWGMRNNPDAELIIKKILTFWREKPWPIYHIQHLSLSPHSPLRPGQVGVEFQDAVTPLHQETVITKNVNSAFIGTDLENTLRQNNIENLFIVGLTTDHCVSTTSRMAANLGFKVTVIADATATFERIGFDDSRYQAEDIHQTALASLHREFATVINSQSILNGPPCPAAQ